MSACPPTGDWAGKDELAAAALPELPGYEFLAKLGQGGMGVVYKARQLESRRLVALKLMRDAALAGPQERARFRIEGEAAARMRHPNIVQVYEIGEHAGRLFLAMEYVEGGSLDAALAGSPQPARQAAELARVIAIAVDHAHGQNIIHRDLKPANILLASSRVVSSERSDSIQSPITDHSPFTIPKIADFGLAKRLDSDSTAWTRDGAVLGTANYMAPEQAAGRVRDIGAAADIYALGAILYEMLTGQAPFRGDSWHETVQRVLHEQPTRPTRLQGDVPRDLETICLKCLEKEPSLRYASALELANDLDRFLERKPVVAVPLKEKERLQRLVARDGYELGDEIGRGPRSVVYHATYGSQRQGVALKTFQEGICGREEWEGRLRDAAELFATLAHPNIIPIHRAGWCDGTAYLEMEYVPQRSLAANLDGRAYSVGQALQLLEQLTETIGYLHRQGAVHGNLKPSNILLAAGGIPRLADFHPTAGLMLGSALASDEDFVRIGYVAPEWIATPDAERRPYTDFYGLGLILYELLTGRPAFQADTREELARLICSQDPEPPSRLNAGVTPELEAVCLRCLHKNPWRRYRRAHDLLKRLQACRQDVDGRPVSRER